MDLNAFSFDLNEEPPLDLDEEPPLDLNEEPPLDLNGVEENFAIEEETSVTSGIGVDDLNSQFEHLQAEDVGTGHADLNIFEWKVDIHRDVYASYIGRYPLLSYFSIAENESIGRQRYTFMEKMLLPFGLPPERRED